jgi:hypothetical protein
MKIGYFLSSEEWGPRARIGDGFVTVGPDAAALRAGQPARDEEMIAEQIPCGPG